jgi:hypothetical protein
MLAVFTEKGASYLNLYMLGILIGGLLIISFVNSLGEFSNLTIRKLFHILAFTMFFPGIIKNVPIPFISKIAFF